MTVNATTATQLASTSTTIDFVPDAVSALRAFEQGATPVAIGFAIGALTKAAQRFGWLAKVPYQGIVTLGLAALAAAGVVLAGGSASPFDIAVAVVSVLGGFGVGRSAVRAC